MSSSHRISPCVFMEVWTRAGTAEWVCMPSKPVQLEALPFAAEACDLDCSVPSMLQDLDLDLAIAANAAHASN